MYRCMLKKEVDAPVALQVPLSEYRGWRPSLQRVSRQAVDARLDQPADFILFGMDLREAAEARGLMAHGTSTDLWEVITRRVTLAAEEPPADAP